MSELSRKEKILQTLKEKSTVKQEVYELTNDAFAELKEIARNLYKDVCTGLNDCATNLKIQFQEVSNFEFRLRIAGDLLIFYQHSNVFTFDNSHQIYQTSYLKDDHTRRYFGNIGIFNFLGDSFEYNRMQDVGYMVGRLFVNRENHFFVEGKRQLGYLFNDITSKEFTREEKVKLLEEIILYTLNFDLLTPPYDAIKEVSVEEFHVVSSSRRLRTGKRLGFHFQVDTDKSEKKMKKK